MTSLRSMLQRLGWTTVALAMVGLCLASCNVGGAARTTGGGSTDNTPPDNDNEDPVDQGVPADEIVVRLINNSDVDVDTQFYFANEPLEDPSEDLFAAQYRVQTGLGVAGTGIIQAGTEDELGRPCSEATYVGTDGGEFLNPDSGELAGTGKRRLLRIGENFDCGNTLIFAFTEENGEYDSVPPVVDSRD